MAINFVLTEGIIRKELWAMLASRDAKALGDVDRHLSVRLTQYDATAQIVATYRGKSAEKNFNAFDLTNNLDVFADMHLSEIADSLVPRHLALLNSLDALWYSTIRPRLIEFANKYHEDDNAA